MSDFESKEGSATANLSQGVQLSVLQYLLERCEFGVAVVSSDGYILEVNSALCHMLEGSAQDLLGSEFDHYFKTEPLAGSVTLQMLGAQVREERRFVTLANNKGWCLLSGAENTSSSKAHTSSFLFLLTNITKQKEAELLLQKAESQIQIIADRLPAMVAYIDRDLHFQFVNEQFEKLYQKPRSQFLGKTVLEALGNSEWQNAKHAIRLALEGKPTQYENFIEQSNAAGISTLVKLTPDTLASGQVRGLFFNITDVSELHRAFAAHEKISAIVDASKDAIYTANSNADITYWSKGAERLYGYSADEIIGQPVGVLIPDSADVHIAKVNAALEKSATVSQPAAKRRHKNGKLIDVSIHVFPIHNKAGEQTAIASIHRDIRELKHLEEQLRHSQRLETAGLLAGGVAHDFNNILTVIQGYCSMLLEDATTDPDANSKKIQQITAIDNAAVRASTLTRQLLAFSQKQRSDAQIINPANMLKDFAPILQRALGENIHLEARLNSQWCIKDDPANFEQVILNLAVNARQSMPGGGSVLIQTDDVELNAWDPMVSGNQSGFYTPKALCEGSYVRVSLTDSGSGIEQQIMERIFEPFFTTRVHGEGAGLGLSVVYGVITQNGGGISVSSEPGKGTSFQVFMQKSQQMAVQELQEAVIEQKGKGTVLLVEDDPEVLKLTRTILESAGYTVYAELEARKALQKNYPHIDLILSDVVMPTMSGPEFIAQWLTRFPDTRYLYMSGYADESMLPFSVLENLLLKPFKPAQLLGKIASSMQSQSQL